VVEAGKAADLVLIEGDPLLSLDALGNARHVLVDGEQRVRRSNQRLVFVVDGWETRR
jgi:imidazolonepropionase-like amidohydrolase